MRTPAGQGIIAAKREAALLTRLEKIGLHPTSEEVDKIYNLYDQGLSMSDSIERVMNPKGKQQEEIKCENRITDQKSN